MAAAEIIHIDLADPPLNISIVEEEALIVFWWRDRPVGQAWNRGAKHRTIEVMPLADQSVAPDIIGSADSIATPSAGRSSASLVICTRDRPEELARCLASLSQQTLTPSEIIVVDNASRDDRTRKVALAAGTTYIREDRPGLDFARNAGVRAASGDIVVYTDDDVCLHPRWLERMVAAFDTPDIAAVTGLVLPAELETEAQRHFETYWSFGRGFRRLDFGPTFFSSDRFHGCAAWEIGAGASMAFRQNIFDRAGLFDERLDVGQAGCSGDSEYWHRILNHGGTCRYEPNAVVFHYHRREISGLASQIFHYMRGHSAALMVQFERSGNWGNVRRAFLTIPWWYTRRIARGLVKGWSGGDRFVGREIAGFASGLRFYFSQPRPKHNARTDEGGGIAKSRISIHQD
jgi:GT2 family glycosyltransferase